MAGEDMAIAQILDKMWELKDVGVNPFVIAHTKNRTKTDVITGEEYDILTSKMTNRNFDEIKTKLHVLGTAYIDRSIAKSSEKNVIGKTVTKGKIEDEKRVIAFRDNNYSVECKSRFTDITDKINFDADEFIKAIEDAIVKAHSKQDGAGKFEEDKAQQEVEKAKKLETKKDDAEIKQDILQEFTEKFKDADNETKTAVVELFKKHEITLADLKDVDKTDIKVYTELQEIMK